MSKQAPGLGVDLREKDLGLDVASQTAIFGTPFDPILAPCSVIEFFSTWCGPCVASIPTLMKEQLKHPHVPFLQISPEEETKLKKFFKGVKLPYAVSSVTREAWEDVSNVFQIQGIPHAVILVEGKAVFSGHPMDPGFISFLKQVNEQFAPKKDEEIETTQ